MYLKRARNSHYYDVLLSLGKKIERKENEENKKDLKKENKNKKINKEKENFWTIILQTV